MGESPGLSGFAVVSWTSETVDCLFFGPLVCIKRLVEYKGVKLVSGRCSKRLHCTPDWDRSIKKELFLFSCLTVQCRRRNLRNGVMADFIANI